jgi:hypothetical protein
LPRDSGGADAGTDPYAGADAQYDCQVLGPLDDPYVDEFRKVVILHTSYVGGWGQLDAVEVAIRYGIGPDHLGESPNGYQVLIESGDGQVMDSFSHHHPGVAWLEGAGCGWVAPENAGPIEIFDFVEPRAQAVRILDVDDEITCEGGTYVGTREELLLTDLRPCLDTFCSQQAAPGDPACP